MISKFAFSILALALGILGYAILMVVIRQRLTLPAYTVGILILNTMFVMAVLFLAYMVTGFDVHASYDNGWMEWPVVVGGFVLGYLPIVIGAVSYWMDEERKNRG